MADVVISAPPESGVIYVEPEPAPSDLVRVTGSRLYIDVLPQNPVVVKATKYVWLRADVLWKGGTAKPTIVSLFPESRWGPLDDIIDPYFYGIEVNDSIGQEWTFRWTYAGISPYGEPTLSNVSAGATFNNAVKTGQNDGPPGPSPNWTTYGFVMRMNTTLVTPNYNSTCTITIIDSLRW